MVDLSKAVLVSLDLRQPLCPEVTVFKINVGVAIWNRDVGWLLEAGV